MTREEKCKLRALHESRAEAAELVAELRNIAHAKRFDRQCFDDDTAFADWAQSRARHLLAKYERQS